MFKPAKLLSISGAAVASLVVAGLLAGAVLPSAGAAVGICRSDPAFNLSNGMTVTLFETLNDDPADILGGSYTLHVPAGVSVMSVDYSGTLGVQQSFSYFADSAAGTYSATSDVLTTSTNVPVTAYMTVGGGWSYKHGDHFAENQQYDINLNPGNDVVSTSTDGTSNTPIANSISYTFSGHLYHGHYDAADSTAGSLVIKRGHQVSFTFTITANTTYVQDHQPVTDPTLTDGQRLQVWADTMSDGSLTASIVHLPHSHGKHGGK